MTEGFPASQPHARALCFGCNYPLRGLEGERCPECGRTFDLNDAATMNLGKPIGRVARFLLAPVGNLTFILLAGSVVAAAVATGVPERAPWPATVDLQFYLRPSSWRTGVFTVWQDRLFSAALWCWLAMFAYWLLRTTVRRITARIRKIPRGDLVRRPRRSVVAAGSFAVMLIVVLFGWSSRIGRNWVAAQLAAPAQTRGGVAVAEPNVPLPRDAEVIALRTALWQSAGADQRIAALKLLVERHPRITLEVLLDRLPHENDPVAQAWQLRLISLYRPVKTEPLLVSFLADSNASVRAAAADALGILHRPAFPIPLGPNWQTATDPPIDLLPLAHMKREFLPGRSNSIAPNHSDGTTIQLSPSTRAALEAMMLTGSTSIEREAAARALLNWPPSQYFLRIAEWGVWLAEGSEIKLVQSVLEDIPPFVHRTGNPVDSFSNRVNQGMQITKPVIHIEADRPLALDVEVQIRLGRPWYAYPRPDDLGLSTGTRYDRFSKPAPPLGALSIFDRTDLPSLSDLSEGYPWLAKPHRRYGARIGGLGAVGNDITGMGLRWQSVIVNPDRLPWMTPPNVPTGDAKYAWWERLRAVHGTSWLSSRGEAERFLYYDGPTNAPAPVDVELARIPGDSASKADAVLRFAIRGFPPHWSPGFDQRHGPPRRAGDDSDPHHYDSGDLFQGMRQNARRNQVRRDYHERVGLLLEVKGGAIRGWVTPIGDPDEASDGAAPERRFVGSSPPLVKRSEVQVSSLEQIDGPEVARHFRRMLVRAGLAGAEADGLIACWRKQFFETEGTRFVLLMSAADYDAFCPIQIRPWPSEMARVGLLLSEFPTSETP